MSKEAAYFGIVLAVALAVVYGGSFDNSFHYDDFHSLVDNPHVRSLAHWSQFFVDPTLFSAMPERAMYRPLVLLSYAINYYLGGYSVWGYHLFNWVVHLGSALCVYALVVALGKSGRCAAWAALFFALHPLCSESVNYISSRSESLCALFYLAALVCYLHWRRGVRGLAPVSVLAFACALLAKSVAIVLPVAVLIYEGWHYRRGHRLASGARSLWRMQWAYWGTAILYLWMARQWLGDSLSEPVRPLLVQWATQAKALVYYAYLTCMPVHLSVEPPFAEAVGWSEGAVLLALALLASGFYLLVRRFNAVALFAGWALLPLLPSSLVPLNVIVNEHRMYLPLAFVCVGGAWFFADRGRSILGNARLWGILALVLLGAISHQRSAIWLNELTLWGDAVERAPFAYRAHMHLAKALEDTGRPTEALVHYERAANLAPEVSETHYNLANALRLSGQVAPALAAYQRSIDLQSDFVPALVNKAALLQDQGAYDQAEQVLRLALPQASTTPSITADIWRRIGVLYAKQRRFSEAETCYEQSLKLDPAQAETFYNLGNLYYDMGRSQWAIRSYRRVLQQRPDHMGALRNLGESLLEVGQYAQAVQLFAQGLRLLPGEVIFYYGMARAQEESGQIRAALFSYRQFFQYAHLDEEARASIEERINELQRKLGRE